MTKPWGFHRAAEREVENVGRWYERKRSGLGAQFVGALRVTLTQLREQPHIGVALATTPAGRTTRSFPMRRFPYAVVYVELDERFVVLACAHFRRKPEYWRLRVVE